MYLYGSERKGTSLIVSEQPKYVPNQLKYVPHCYVCEQKLYYKLIYTEYAQSV